MWYLIVSIPDLCILTYFDSRPTICMKNNCLWPCSLAVPVLVGWIYGFVVLCPGTPEGSTGSCSGFKASQKTGQQLKVSSDRLEKLGIEPATPGLQDIGLSPTPRRLKTTFCGFPRFKLISPGWFKLCVLVL